MSRAFFFLLVSLATFLSASVAFADVSDTHKLYADHLNYWDNDIINISTKGNGSVMTIVFTKPTAFSFPATNNASCVDEDANAHTITCTNTNDKFWVRIQAPASNTERTIVPYNITWNSTLGTSGNGISGPGNLIAMPDNRTVRLIAGDEGGRRYFADSVFGTAPFYIGDDFTSFVTFVSLEPTVMSYLHSGSSGIRKGNETHAVCNLPTSFGTTVMETHLGRTYTNNTVVFDGKLMATSQNKPMWAKVRSTVVDGNIFQFNCTNIWYFCEECGGYVNVSDQQTLSLTVQNSTPFVWDYATPSATTIGKGDGGKIEFNLTFTNNESYEIDDVLLEISFADPITAGRPRWVAVTKEIAAIKEDRLVIQVANWKAGQSIYVNATARFSFSTEFDGNTVNLTARALYYPEWERFISGGGRNPYRQEMKKYNLVTLDDDTNAIITTLSGGGGGSPLSIFCSQQSEPNETVYCTTTARDTDGSFVRSQQISYTVLYQNLSTFKSGYLTEVGTGTYITNFTPTLNQNYLVYVNWSNSSVFDPNAEGNTPEFSASVTLFSEIFHLTPEQNATLYGAEDKAGELNSTLLSESNFGGNNLSDMRTRIVDLNSFLTVLREESKDNVILVTDAIHSTISLAQKYDAGTISDSEAKAVIQEIRESVEPAVQEVRDRISASSSIGERAGGPLSTVGKGALSIVSGTAKLNPGLLLLFVLALVAIAYVFELDKKLLR